MFNASKKLVFLVLTIATTFASCCATAQTQSDAEIAANNFLLKFDSPTHPSSLYESLMSGTFKSSMNKQKFIENIGMLRIQMGGASTSRQLVGSQSLSQLQGVTSPGPFFYFRYVSNYPVAKFAQDITLERENNSWKIVGFYFFVVPQ